MSRIVRASATITAVLILLCAVGWRSGEAQIKAGAVPSFSPASALWLEQPVQQEHSRKDPAMAGFLSFLIPGGGQFYNGQAGKGILMLGGTIGSVALALTAGIEDEEICFDGYCESVEGTNLNAVFWIGLGSAAAIELWSVLDAISAANRLNREHGISSIPENERKHRTRLTLQPQIVDNKAGLRAALQVSY